MRKIIFSACAAVASLLAVNVMMADRKRQSDKVELNSPDDRTQISDETATYLIYDGSPFEEDGVGAEEMLDCLNYTMGRKLIHVVIPEDNLDSEKIVATVVSDILERYRLGVNQNFKIVATGLFAQLAINIKHDVDAEYAECNCGIFSPVELVLVQPILGWQQLGTYEEHLARLAERKRAKLAESLLGNLAFRENNGEPSIAFRRGMLGLMTTSVDAYIAMLGERVTVIYDSWSPECGVKAFLDLLEKGGVGALDLRDYLTEFDDDVAGYQKTFQDAGLSATS